MGKRVFVSHSSRDEETARQFVAGMEDRGVSCWVAWRDVPLGSPYGSAIIEGIRNSETVVVLLSEYSAASDQVERELERASSYEKKIAGFRLDSTEPGARLEYYVAGRQWKDLGRLTPERLDEIAKLLGGTAPSTGAPKPGEPPSVRKEPDVQRHARADTTPAADTGITTTARPWVRYALVATLLVVAGGAYLFFNPGGAAPRHPYIAEFHAEPTRIAPGDSVKLSWKIEHADHVRIAPLDTGPYQPAGYTYDRPQSTVTYVLTAENSLGQRAKDRITVQVEPPRAREGKDGSGVAKEPPAKQGPTITSFTANPETVVRNYPVQLSWKVHNASEVLISREGRDLARSTEMTGVFPVVPLEDTSYTLTVFGENGVQISQERAIHVIDPPPPLIPNRPVKVDPKTVRVAPTAPKGLKAIVQ